jgi:hypothetical protein
MAGYGPDMWISGDYVHGYEVPVSLTNVVENITAMHSVVNAIKAGYDYAERSGRLDIKGFFPIMYSYVHDTLNSLKMMDYVHDTEMKEVELYDKTIRRSVRALAINIKPHFQYIPDPNLEFAIQIENPGRWHCDILKPSVRALMDLYGPTFNINAKMVDTNGSY